MLQEDINCVIEFNGKKYDSRHGGPFDRGSADSWYCRPRDPHFYLEESYTSREVGAGNMTAEQIEAYIAGYEWNERFGGHKDYD